MAAQRLKIRKAMEKAVSKRQAVADFLRSNTKRIAGAVAALALFSLLF